MPFSLIWHFGDSFILKTKQAGDGLLERDIGWVWRIFPLYFISVCFLCLLENFENYLLGLFKGPQVLCPSFCFFFFLSSLGAGERNWMRHVICLFNFPLAMALKIGNLVLFLVDLSWQCFLTFGSSKLVYFIFSFVYLPTGNYSLVSIITDNRFTSWENTSWNIHYWRMRCWLWGCLPGDGFSSFTISKLLLNVYICPFYGK